MAPFTRSKGKVSKDVFLEKKISKPRRQPVVRTQPISPEWQIDIGKLDTLCCVKLNEDGTVEYSEWNSSQE